MAEIRTLQSASYDVDHIARYINENLYNESAALNFLENYLTKTNNLNPFPRKYTVHESINPLDYEYRRFMVGNYIVFYTIDEENNKISIIRVLHERQDMDNALS